MAIKLTPYNKPYQNSAALCNKLQSQGLVMENQVEAEKILQRYSYYRFKAYLIPFKDTVTKTFHHGATFDHCHQLYLFDSELRGQLFPFIEKIEIGVRSYFDQWMTSKTDNPFWYLDSSLFSHNGDQIKTVSRVRESFKGSKEEFAKHYREKYYNEYCPFYRDLPPAWVAIEIMTFGNVVKLLENITEESIKMLKLDRFTKKVGIQNFASLRSWLASIREVRNHCGHHNRLFNRNLNAPTGIKRYMNKHVNLVKTQPVQGKREEDQLNRLYTTLIAMQLIYLGLGYTDKLGPIMQSLFQSYPIAQKFKISMGFPMCWEQEPILFRQ